MLFQNKLFCLCFYDLYQKISLFPQQINLLSAKGDSRDMCFVKDVARAIFHLNKKIIPKGEIFNIGTGKNNQIIDIARLLFSSDHTTSSEFYRTG